MADFEVKLFGGKKLQRKLDELAKGSRGVVNRSMRPSAKRVRAAVSAAAPVDTGNLKAAMLKAPVRALKGRGIAGVGIALPYRPDAGLDPKEDGYYPAVIEFGRQGVPPNPFIRRTVDGMADTEFILIGRKMSSEIEKKL